MAKRKNTDILEHHLSRRERQIMGAIYRQGKASVAEIVDGIPDPPTQDAVRRLCHILEEKGLLRSRADGPRKVYSPIIDSKKARKTALDNIIDTFCEGSPQMLVAALLDARGDELSAEDVERLQQMIDAAEKREDRK